MAAARPLWPQADTTDLQLFRWASAQPYCVLLHGCGTQTDAFGTYDWLLAVNKSHQTDYLKTVDALQLAIENQDWLFGAFSYEAQSAFEPRMRRDPKAFLEVPETLFFVPDWVVAQRRGHQEVEVMKGDANQLWKEVKRYIDPPKQESKQPELNFQSNFTRERYHLTVEKVRQHIRQGDTYELNLTQCFRAEGRLNDPFGFWLALTETSPVPFAGYGKWQDLHLACASPERFLQLQGDKLRTQPIKGTSPRYSDRGEDEKSRQRLQNSPKEQAENVMIVDLSRNDLNRVCETGTVKVPHLFEVQPYRQVFQMVSTVEGRKKQDLSPLEIFGTVFPPGSMTGAPKIRTCELIEEMEGEGRGLYSGSLGYFDPIGNFDFNVVIRSLVFDGQRDALSYHVGGAVTWDSDPEDEYQETLLKASAILKTLKG
jgi:para-aminobenzoate synthetase component 1